MFDKLFIAFQYAVPQHALTRLAGYLAASHSPLIKTPFINLFIRKFNVNMAEAVNADPNSYSSFNDFFTRALKAGVRPVAVGVAEVASPADGAISQIGDITAGAVFQAKGKSFDVRTLLGDAERAQDYLNGLFTTIYLSPRDYHRLHMPVDGKLLSTSYIPGKLFSVNTVTAENIDGLFAMNERLVMHFETAMGPMAAVMVGAMIVGSMETVWQQDVAQGGKRVAHSDWASQNITLKKGDELGRFKLGSTIILCFGPGAVKWRSAFSAATPVQMGVAIADATA